ncbi:MAG TPA: undecaprenyl-phosphate glucose phosphotransferase [Steroidobacteraceae bacterium]|nr:undecaprenyl-phosphate glucose phosphotransferase [Steroidobacteraceae bacterium]
MSAPPGSVPRSAPDIGHLPLRDRSADVSASEPIGIFALKSLLYPTTPVITLMLCLMAWQASLRGPYFLIAVLSFLGVADVLDVMPARFLSARAAALRSFFDITARWGVLLVFIYLLMKLSGLGLALNHPMLWTWALTTPFALWGAEYVGQRVLYSSRAAAGPVRKAVIVGATAVGSRLDAMLASRPVMRIQVSGYFDDRARGRIAQACAGRLLGTLDDVKPFVLAEGIELVYITLPMAPRPRIVKLVESLRDSTASIYFVPDLASFEMVQPHFDLVEGIPVIAVCDSPFYGIRALAKRASDLVVAALALVIGAPLLIAVAIGVKLSSPGPVIYRQRRCGLDGRGIVVHKFRSLRVVEDGATSYTQVARGDPRLTRFGAFIRKTSLDELPQLFNVLTGEMSIVGPRPHAVAVNENYRQLIPGYMVRHKVKPGITGWAQVNGFRGGDDLESMSSRIAYDLEYLRHWSLGLDLVILFKTVTVIWSDSRAY